MSKIEELKCTNRTKDPVLK